jgi:AcrR family transcriptional regulator
MAEKPYEDIHSSEIIARSGYCKRTFYAHYKDKDDLAEQIMENEINTFVKIICGTIRKYKRIPLGHHFDDKLYEPALYLFQHVREDTPLYNIILHSLIPWYTLDNFADRINQAFLVSVDVETSIWPAGLKREFYFYANTYAYLIYIKYWEKQSYAQSPEEMARQVTCMIRMRGTSAVLIK